MEGITKEELHAIIETQSKATEQMVIIANSLKEITEEQKKITEKLSNGLKKDIITEICDFSKNCHAAILKGQESQELVINQINKNIEFSKFFISIVGIAIVIATVVVQVIIDRKVAINLERSSTIQTLK